MSERTWSRARRRSASRTSKRPERAVRTRIGTSPAPAARARAVSGARSPCTTIVPDLNTWNFGFPPASFSFESNTTTRGSAPRTSRTVRWGSSLRTVPAPTAMASWVARSRWPSRRDALPVIHRLCPFAQAIMPSRLTAAFNVTHGRPRVEAKWTSR